MKTSSLVLAVSLALAWQANAAILVYKGTVVQKQQGNAAESRVSFRSFLLIDSVDASSRRIDYYPGAHLYVTWPQAQFVTNQVTLKSGRTETVYARVGTDPMMANFVKGINARLQVATNQTVIAPRTLDWNSQAVGALGGAAPSTLDETGVLGFHQAFTSTINNHNEGLPEAWQRMKTALEAAGYRLVQAP